MYRSGGFVFKLLFCKNILKVNRNPLSLPPFQPPALCWGLETRGNSLTMFQASFPCFFVKSFCGAETQPQFDWVSV